MITSKPNIYTSDTPLYFSVCVKKQKEINNTPQRDRQYRN